jgi:cysteine desulfurase
MVSIMAVNNEIGVAQPIKEIGAICRKRGVFFHTDAAQAVGKVPLNVDEMNIDLMSISGHKLYGPKGIGALYVRRKQPRVRYAFYFKLLTYIDCILSSMEVDKKVENVLELYQHH